MTLVEQTLARATKLMTVLEIKAAALVDEATVRAELKRLAQQGQIEHIPGRGRYDGRCGLLRPIAKAAPAAAQYDASKNESLAVIEAAPVLEIASDARNDEVSATAESKLREIVAQCRDAAGFGIEGLDAFASPDGVPGFIEQQFQDLREKLRAAESQRDAWREVALRHECTMPDDLDGLLMALSITRRDAVAGLVDLRALNASLENLLAIERTTCAALAAQISSMTSPTLESFTPAGYLVRAPKRKPRLVTKQETAQAAALAAARNGSRRSEVFALVPVGVAKHGAVWSAVK